MVLAVCEYCLGEFRFSGNSGLLNGHVSGFRVPWVLVVFGVDCLADCVLLSLSQDTGMGPPLIVCPLLLLVEHAKKEYPAARRVEFFADKKGASVKNIGKSAGREIDKR